MRFGIVNKYLVYYKMDKLRLNQKKLSKLMNWSETTTSRKINSVRRLTPMEEKMLCDLLELTIDELYSEY